MGRIWMKFVKERKPGGRNAYKKRELIQNEHGEEREWNWRRKKRKKNGIEGEREGRRMEWKKGEKDRECV